MCREMRKRTSVERVEEQPSVFHNSCLTSRGMNNAPRSSVYRSSPSVVAATTT